MRGSEIGYELFGPEFSVKTTPLTWGGGLYFYFFPNVFPLSSQWVFIKFQICPPSSQCLPRHFSIAPHFYPICFGKCCPPFTYVGGLNIGTSIVQIQPSILGSLHCFICFEWWANEIGSLQETKIELGRYLI